MSPTITEANKKSTGGYVLKAGLPAGLSLHPDTGVITGIPLTIDTNTHSTIIVVTDAAGNTGEHTIIFPTVDAAPSDTTSHTTTRTRRSGGGGGGGSSFAPAITTAQQLTPTITPGITPQPVFTRTLTRGSTGEDVRTLQKFLNKNSYTVSTTGPGSSGKETTYFGPATERALKAFQAANDLLPLGILDDGTRYLLNALLLTVPQQTVRERLIILIQQLIQELVKRGVTQ